MTSFDFFTFIHTLLTINTPFLLHPLPHLTEFLDVVPASRWLILKLYFDWDLWKFRFIKFLHKNAAASLNFNILHLTWFWWLKNTGNNIARALFPICEATASCHKGGDKMCFNQLLKIKVRLRLRTEPGNQY